MNIVDFEMNIEDAVESPRFHHQWLPDVIQFENRGFSDETLSKLQGMGHEYVFRRVIGEANCIQIHGDLKLKLGSADSRRAASAIAY